MTSELSNDQSNKPPKEVKVADWRKFTAAIKALPLWRRFLLYPYAYYVAYISKDYAVHSIRSIRYSELTKENSASNNNPLGSFLSNSSSAVKQYFVNAKAAYGERSQYYLEEFEACCNVSSFRSVGSLFAEQLQDARQYCRSLTKPPLATNIVAVPFAIAYLIVLTIMRLIAELVLAGKAKEWFVNLYSESAVHFNDPREIEDMAAQARPVVLIGLYAAPATAVILVGKQLISDTLALFKSPRPHLSTDCLRFKQNIDKQKENGPAAFYFSPVFGWTLFFFFVSGIPAFISFWLYTHLGIDPLFGFPSHEKDFLKVFVIINLYIASLSWCLATLFFTGYFTYLTNFGSTEYDIEIYPDLIKQLPIKGWAADILFYPLHHSLRRLFWCDVQTVKLIDSEAELKAATENMNNPFLKKFSKINSLFQNLLRKLDVHSEYLEIATANSSINIRLWELSQKERSQLFYSLRKYAPDIYLNPLIQEALTGSTVLRDPRYTEIWFDVLTRTNHIECQEALGAGSKLRQGKFTINKKLASGGQATVYLGQDAEEQPIIIKEFQLAPGESLGSLIESAAVFESESTILSQLDHPGIVKLHDLFIEGNKVYLALEYIDGKTLRELVQDKGQLDESLVIDRAKQMCDILDYLHKHSPVIVHRDFTPENLILQTNGRLKLIDFSAAQGQKSHTNNCAGKHAYTPPEQFRGEACAQSDIYAFGATVYFLLTGEDPQPISKSSIKNKPANISNQLNLIVERCTELKLADRYESVSWLKTELNAIV